MPRGNKPGQNQGGGFNKKISPELCRIVRSARLAGMKIKDISIKYGISYGAISGITNAFDDHPDHAFKRHGRKKERLATPKVEVNCFFCNVLIPLGAERQYDQKWFCSEECRVYYKDQKHKQNPML